MHLLLPVGQHREGWGQRDSARGPPEATQTLKICFAKRKKRLLTMAASSPHGAASNTIRTLVGHSVRAQFAQL